MKHRKVEDTTVFTCRVNKRIVEEIDRIRGDIISRNKAVELALEEGLPHIFDRILERMTAQKRLTIEVKERKS